MYVYEEYTFFPRRHNEKKKKKKRKYKDKNGLQMIVLYPHQQREEVINLCDFDPKRESGILLLYDMFSKEA